MDASDSKSSNLPTTDEYNVSTVYAIGDIGVPSSSHLTAHTVNVFRQDDATTIWSYRSEWSTNYTKSNLPGPGRTLGNLYALLAKPLERQIEKRVSKKRRQQKVEAVNLWKEARARNFKSLQGSRKIAYCNTILENAQSNAPTIQIIAFKTIAYIIKHCSEMRDSFTAGCKVLGEPIEAAIFSWKRPGIEHGVRWDLYFRVASYSLTSWPSRLMDDFARSKRLLDFRVLEKLFENSRFSGDPLAVIYLICRRWNGHGLLEYLEKEDFRGRFLRWLLAAMLALQSYQLPY